MKHLLILLSLIVLFGQNIKAQDTNLNVQDSIILIGQDYYYKAKSQYELGNYSSALSYAQKSIDTIGGTNEELQYLIVLAYVGKKDWINAETELQKYFLVDAHNSSRITIKYFDESVNRLTNDQKRDLEYRITDIKNYANDQREQIKQEMRNLQAKWQDLMDSGKYREALSFTDKLTFYTEAYRLQMKASIHMKLEETDLALEMYKKSYELDEKNTDVIYSIGLIYFNYGVEKFKSSIDANTNNDDYLKGRSEAIESFKMALLYFEEVVELTNINYAQYAIDAVTQTQEILSQLDKDFAEKLQNEKNTTKTD